MKHFKLIAVLAALIISIPVIAQDETGSLTSINQPSRQEEGRQSYYERDAFYPGILDDQLKHAQETGNTSETERIRQEMDAQIPPQYKYPSKFDVNDDRQADVVYPPFNNDWYNTDVTLYSGSVKYGAPYFRQIDMKMGEDGNMYVAVNRAPVSGTNGRIDVYRSSNGGVSWVYTSGVTTSTAYYGTVSLLVELRSESSNMDSIRIVVFYTRSSNANNDDATMNFATWRRNGSAWYSAQIAAPPAGQEYSFSSSVSDGAFYNTATWVGVMCTESNNALTATNNFRYYRSLDWGLTWTGVTISTAFDDFYPSAELRPGSGPSTDSVWIAVERRLTTTQYEIRIIRTRWSPVASSNTYYVTSGGSGIKYEKPALTVKQNRTCDSALFTVTKNGVSYYCPTVNGGGSWNTDYILGGTGNGNNKAFTWCASSSNGPDPFMGIWVSSDGDSVNVRLGGAIGDLGSTVYKRNSYATSTTVSPTCIVYTPNLFTNRAAFSYAGFGPANIYVNQETLITGITQNGNQIPEQFNLSQNYPNPFNPTTNINFSLPKSGFVKLVVYDITGREVAGLVNQQLNAGTYKVDFDASGLSSGVYFYRVNTEGFSDVKKMMLVK